ncbi:hypothetical protein DKT68_12935 [Micromonospora acroterricola]|uniref:STAS domain-containing protein n=1 Tax=Micromonospora acroterricola TaxID=2202421 RepID=A0A317D2Y8_9ACTN|nr:STAS domain-containing protein [Micromonospora acroterricola]PWR09241.1 hypothetical protein DKT68_12935 [Micromonospora acroterricola]
MSTETFFSLAQSCRRSRPPVSAHLPDAVLRLGVTRDGPAMLVNVDGEVDMSNAQLLVELVTFACRPPSSLVELDLSRAAFFDAHGIAALLRADHAVSAAGGRMTVRDPSPFLLRLLGITGVLGHLEITVGLSPHPLAGLATADLPSLREMTNSGAHRYGRPDQRPPRQRDDTGNAVWRG